MKVEERQRYYNKKDWLLSFSTIFQSSIQELKKEDVEVSSSSTTSEVKTMTHKLLGELIKRDLQESFTSRQVSSAERKRAEKRILQKVAARLRERPKKSSYIFEMIQYFQFEILLLLVLFLIFYAILPAITFAWWY